MFLTLTLTFIVEGVTTFTSTLDLYLSATAVLFQTVCRGLVCSNVVYVCVCMIVRHYWLLYYRYYCMKVPESLPKLLQAVKWSCRDDVAQVCWFLRIWIDEKTILTGDQWIERVKKDLGSLKPHFLALCSRLISINQTDNIPIELLICFIVISLQLSYTVMEYGHKLSSIRLTAKVSEQLTRKCPLGTRFYDFQPPKLAISLQTPHFLQHRCCCHLANQFKHMPLLLTYIS